MKTDFHQYTKDNANAPEVFTNWQKNPSDENTRQIYKYIQPTISSALNSYAGGDKTLTLRANILATNALKTFDPSKGTYLKTHIYNSLKRLTRYRAERNEVVHIPENIRYDAKRVSDFVVEYKDKRGRLPSLAETADGAKLSIKKVKKASLYGKETFDDYTVNEKNDSLYTKDSDPLDMVKDYVYHDLDNTNKKVFEWTTGYMGSKILPKNEQAKKLGISAAALSGRISTIQKRLEQ